MGPMRASELLTADSATRPDGAAPAATLVDALRATVRLTLFTAGLLVAFVAVAAGRALLVTAPRAVGERFGVAMLHLFMRFGAWVFGVRVFTQGPLPPRGSLIVANHRSYLDAVALASVTPTTFLAKREVASWPVMGLGARIAGVVFVDRGDASSREAAGGELVARVERGATVVNFPEGTTTREPRPLPFRAGLFRRVAGRNVTVVPARIDYDDPQACWTGDDSFVPHLVGVATRRRTVVRLRFSPALRAHDLVPSELLRRSYEAVDRLP